MPAINNNGTGAVKSECTPSASSAAQFEYIQVQIDLAPVFGIPIWMIAFIAFTFALSFFLILQCLGREMDAEPSGSRMANSDKNVPDDFGNPTSLRLAGSRRSRALLCQPAVLADAGQWHA